MFRLATIVLFLSLGLFDLLAGGCRQEASPTASPTVTTPSKPTTTTTAPPTIPATAPTTPAKPAPTTPAATPVTKALPKTISLTTWSPGTTTYVAGLAIGSVLSKYADIKLAVEPAASPIPGYTRMAKGEVELVFSAGSFMYGTYAGLYGNPKYEKVRDLFFTYNSNYSLITRNDTGIKTVQDLKGKKVSVIFPAAPVSEVIMRTLLKEYGMDMDKDIVAISHSTILEMYDNIKERRAEAGFSTALRINLEELERSPGGAYIVPIPKEKILAVQKQFPFVFPENLPAGFAGAKGETLSFLFGLGVTSGADVSEDLVYTVVKTVMEHLDEIRPAHADLAGFTIANFAKYPTIPFHAGAIRYYKEKGVWTPELENFQKDILEKSG